MQLRMNPWLIDLSITLGQFDQLREHKHVEKTLRNRRRRVLKELRSNDSCSFQSKEEVLGVCASIDWHDVLDVNDVQKPRGLYCKAGYMDCDHSRPRSLAAQRLQNVPTRLVKALEQLKFRSVSRRFPRDR